MIRIVPPHHAMRDESNRMDSNFTWIENSTAIIYRVEPIACSEHSRTIGLVVKSNVAIVGPWVRFPDGAIFLFFAFVCPISY
jgi:hypothetical protein